MPGSRGDVPAPRPGRRAPSPPHSPVGHRPPPLRGASRPREARPPGRRHHQQQQRREQAAVAGGAHGGAACAAASRAPRPRAGGQGKRRGGGRLGGKEAGPATAHRARGGRWCRRRARGGGREAGRAAPRCVRGPDQTLGFFFSPSSGGKANRVLSRPLETPLDCATMPVCWRPRRLRVLVIGLKCFCDSLVRCFKHGLGAGLKHASSAPPYPSTHREGRPLGLDPARWGEAPPNGRRAFAVVNRRALGLIWLP